MFNSSRKLAPSQALGRVCVLLSQLLGVQEPLGSWSHPPNLCSVVTRPLPSRLTRMMPVGFGGTQVTQDNLI